MARQTFTSAQVLTAAQMTTLQASVWSDDVNTQTGTTYTLVLTDAGKQVTVNNASGVTLTVPTNATVAFATGVRMWIINLGTGALTIAGAGGVTVSEASGDLNFVQYAIAMLIKVGTDSWVIERTTDPDDDQVILANQIFS